MTEQLVRRYSIYANLDRVGWRKITKKKTGKKQCFHSSTICFAVPKVLNNQDHLAGFLPFFHSVYIGVYLGQPCLPPMLLSFSLMQASHPLIWHMRRNCSLVHFLDVRRGVNLFGSLLNHAKLENYHRNTSMCIWCSHVLLFYLAPSQASKNLAFLGPYGLHDSAFRFSNCLCGIQYSSQWCVFITIICAWLNS